jgi:hypothetical protein
LTSLFRKRKVLSFLERTVRMSDRSPNWKWIAASLLEALKLARAEIKAPGAARSVGKDIDAIVATAIAMAEGAAP